MEMEATQSRAMATAVYATDSIDSQLEAKSPTSTIHSPRNVPTSAHDGKGQVALSGALDSLSHLSLTDILKLREVLARCDEGSLADAYVNTLTSRMQSKRNSQTSSLKTRSAESSTLSPALDDAQQRRRSKSVTTPQKPPATSPVPVPSIEAPSKIPEILRPAIQRKAIPSPLTVISPALSNASDSSASSKSTAPKCSTSVKSQRSSVSSLDQEINELLGDMTPITPAKPAPWNNDPPSPLREDEKFPKPVTLQVPFDMQAARVSRAETDILSLLDYSTTATAEEKRSEFWIRLQRDLMRTPLENGVQTHLCPESNCDSEFVRTRDLTKHLEAEHTKLLKYMCLHSEPGKGTCEFATFDKTKWEDHHRAVHRCSLDSPRCCLKKELERKIWACGLCHRQRFLSIAEWSRHYCKHLKQEGKTKDNVSFSMKMFNLLWQDSTSEPWGKQSEKIMKDGKFWIGWNERSANAQDLMHVLECGIFEGKELSDPEVASRVAKLAITIGKHPTAANVRASKYPTRTAYLKPFPRHLAHVARDASTKSA